MDIEEIKQKWLESSDNDVIRAAAVDKDNYPIEVQAIIQEEVQRRDLGHDVEQQMTFLKKRADAKFRKREIRRVSYRIAQSKFLLKQLTDRKILFSIALFVIAMVVLSFLAQKGYRVSRAIIVVGLIELSVFILLESKNRLGRCMWGWSITTFLILLILAYFAGALKPHTNFGYAIGGLIACWMLGLWVYHSIVCEQQYGRQPGDKELLIKCPNCHQRLEGAKENMVGDTGVCPKCKTEFEIKSQ
jgi:hypothetical protein